MNKFRGVLVCGLALLMMLAMAVVVAPDARAYSAATWQAAFAGTGALPCQRFPLVCASFNPPLPATAIVSNGFWGWCDFVGVSSGTGDCEVSDYFHISIPSVGVVSVTCEHSFAVTAWSLGTSLFLPQVPPFLGKGIFLNSGTITDNPASPVCTAMFPPGAFSFSTDTPGSNGDTGIPALAGHFNTNQAIFTLPGQFAITVTQVFTT